MAYDSIEPFGDQRADVRQAITSAVIANVNRRKGRAAYKVRDFMAVRPQTRLMTGDEMKKIFKQFAGRQ